MIKNKGKIFLIAAFVSLACLLASPVLAWQSPLDMDIRSPPADDSNRGMPFLFSHLEDMGFDLTAVQAAVANGDLDTARTMMRQFMEEHRSELHIPSVREIGADGQTVLDTLEELPGPAVKENTTRMLNQLDRLEQQGFDVSSIRAAIASGDLDMARTLMQQFMEDHRDEFSAPHGSDRDDRVHDQLDRLEEQGFDVSSIRAAVASGDMNTARTLLQQLIEEHRDELPVLPANDQDNRMLNRLNRLEEQGFDVSSIRAAVASGDSDTAHTLMQQFMEENRDDLPVPPVRNYQEFNPGKTG